MPISTSISGPHQRGLAFALLLLLWLQLIAGCSAAWTTFRLRHGAPDGSCSGGGGSRSAQLEAGAKPYGFAPAPTKRSSRSLQCAGGGLPLTPVGHDAEAPFEVAEVPHDAPGWDHRRTEAEGAVETALAPRSARPSEGDVGGREQRLQAGDGCERVHDQESVDLAHVRPSARSIRVVECRPQQVVVDPPFRLAEQARERRSPGTSPAKSGTRRTGSRRSSAPGPAARSRRTRR